MNKYGRGKLFSEKCQNCGHKEELLTDGVHESESGGIRVYAEDDMFSCGKCRKDSIEQQEGNLFKHFSLLKHKERPHIISNFHFT